jgi:hypothetical protein
MKKGGITLILCVAVLGALGCDNRQAEESRKRQQAEAERQKTTHAIAELARVHNAVVNWRQGLAAKEPLGRIYSVELAPVLIRSDERPLLFIADVLDISSTGNSYTCSFQADVNLSRKIELILGCTPEQATQIGQGASGKYAIVAHITSLGPPVQVPEENGSGEGRIAFRALGKCLGEVPVGKDYDEDMWEMLSGNSWSD